MSGSMPNTEDVISSIRRLVSEEKPAALEKFVLTPALRVASPEPALMVPKAAPSPRRQTLEQRIADLEAAVGAQADEWEPEGDTADLPAPGALILDYKHSTSEQPAGRQLYSEDEFVYFAGAAPHDDAPAAKENMFAPAPAAQPIDEEALRDLVAQIVREELQGELGERITRNVRRLVRREVQRALTMREFG